LNYVVGQVIAYRAFGGVKRFAVVTSKEPMNGQSGFAGIELNSNFEPKLNEMKYPTPQSKYSQVWGYDHQITAVFKLFFPDLDILLRE